MGRGLAPGPPARARLAAASRRGQAVAPQRAEERGADEARQRVLLHQRADPLLGGVEAAGRGRGQVPQRELPGGVVDVHLRAGDSVRSLRGAGGGGRWAFPPEDAPRESRRPTLRPRGPPTPQGAQAAGRDPAVRGRALASAACVSPEHGDGGPGRPAGGAEGTVCVEA